MNDNDSIVFVRKSSGLVKALTWWDVFLLVVSAPAGSGILYYSVSTASSYPGGNIVLSFLLGMVLVFPVIYVAAITSSLVPRSGSLYVLISRVLSPSLAFLAAALFFVGYTLSVGVVAFVITNVSGGILALAGRVARSDVLSGWGATLQEPTMSALGGALLVVLTWLLVLRGIRAFRSAMRMIFLFAVGAIIVTIVLLLALPHSGGAPARFDAVWGPGVYQRIMEAASRAGWTSPSFSWQATFDLLLVVLFSYGGLELVSYASGEMSHSDSKTRRGYLGGWLCLAAIYTLIAYSVTYAFGDFIGAYDFLFQKHKTDLEQIMPAIAPSIPFYVSSIVPSPWIGITISLALCLWLVNTMIPYFFSPSRLIFALAMDRSIPAALANVNSKTNAPTNASHLTLVVALAGVLLNLLNVGVVLGTILFCALFIYWLYGLSAMLLPYRRPDLYQRLEQSERAGLPVISVVGLLSFAVGWFVIFVAVRQLSMPIAIFLSIMMGLIMLLYTVRVAVNRKSGVDIDEVYDQIPPD